MLFRSHFAALLTCSHSLEVDGHLNAFWNDNGVNKDVFVVGDASALISGKLPATAQVANQEAKQCAVFSRCYAPLLSHSLQCCEGPEFCGARSGAACGV